MAAFVLTLVLLALAWLVHVIWWRISLPRNQTRMLAVVFIFTPVIFAGGWKITGAARIVALADLPGMALFYLVAVGCYLITYSGVEETSPSLEIFRALKSARAQGCEFSDLTRHITVERFVHPRLIALHRDGFVAVDDSGGRLTPKGRRAALIAQKLGSVFKVDAGG